MEYVIHTVEAELSNRIHHVSNDQDLYNEVHSIVTGLRGASFDRYFAHCGYTSSETRQPHLQVGM